MPDFTDPPDLTELPKAPAAPDAPRAPRALSAAGFSMIELMVVVAIAAIVAAFAIPSYRDHLQRSYLPEASSGLLLTAMRLEQYYQDNRSYLNGEGCGVALPPSHRFAFSCVPAVDGQAFVLTASGVEREAMAGFTFTLDQSGDARTIALPADWGQVPVNCWVTKRGGAC